MTVVRNVVKGGFLHLYLQALYYSEIFGRVKPLNNVYLIPSAILLKCHIWYSILNTIEESLILY